MGRTLDIFGERNKRIYRAFSNDCILFLKAVWGKPGSVFFMPFVKFHKRIIERIEKTKKLIVVVTVPREFGKALDIQTPIATPDGWKLMKDLKKGDYVFDENGLPCKVTFATGIQKNRECYQVQFSDGECIVADAEHLWQVKDRWSDKPFKILKTIKMKDRVKLPVNRNNKENRYSIPLTKPLQLPEKKLLIHPYLLGVWLGDGTSAGGRMTCGNDDGELLNHVRSTGCSVEKSNQDLIYILGKTYGHINSTNPSFQSKLRKLGLINNKHIPNDYLRASYSQRLELLQGLMDTDGTISKRGYCEITLKQNKLVDGMTELLASMGIKFTNTERMVILNGKKCGPYIRITFPIHNDIPIFKLSRKLDRIRDSSFAGASKNRFITNIIRVASVPVKCIQVDSPSNLYLAGTGMIPTHNTKLLSFGYIIWAVMFRKYSYILHISYDLNKKGKQVLRDIKRGFKSKAFVLMFGDLQGKFWSQEKIHLYSERWHIDCIIEVSGADQSSFGLSEWKNRPDLIILDDVETLKTIKNKELVKALLEKLRTEIIPAAEAMDERGRQAKIIIIGTPLAAQTFLTEVMKWTEDIELIRYPAIVDNKSVPGMNEDLDLPEGASIWEARWSREYLDRKRRFFIRTNSIQTWLTQYMLDAKTGNPMQFDVDKLIEVDFKDYQKLIHGGKVITTVDMAYTKKDSNDAVGITTSLHLDGSEIIYLESSKHRVTANVLFDILWDLKQKYALAGEYLTSIEAKVFELVKLYFLEIQMRKNRPLEIYQLHDRGKKKDDRIGRMIPFYEVGLMKFVKGANQVLLEEMWDWKGTTSGEDNVVDAAAYQVDFVELSQEQLEENSEKNEKKKEFDEIEEDDFYEEEIDRDDTDHLIKRCDELQKKHMKQYREDNDDEYPAFFDLY